MKFRKPRCVLVCAIAPEGTTPPEANRAINAMTADTALPLVLWHDHFLGELGGVILYFVETEAERDALALTGHLPGWKVEMRPLIYSSSPAAFDAQISYTMQTYRGLSWETAQNERRPTYGNPQQEVLTASEDEVS